MKKLFFVALLFLMFFASCQRLDSNLYNTTDKLTKYELDNYTGVQDFILDASYDIPDSLVHIFTLNSQAPDESEPTTIYAIYIGDVNTISTDTVIMYCHGNKWHMDFYWQRAKLMAHTGGKNHYGVLMIDYRGFGMSDGEPSEEGLNADADAALKWLSVQGLTNDRLVIYGFSLGSAPATELCARPRAMSPSKLILEAPIGSADVMAADGSQLNMPGSYFTNLELDNAEKIKSVQQPFLWLHGTNDNFLNYRTHGQVVYDNYSGLYKEFHLADGADHGDVPEYLGFFGYLSILDAFIRH